MKRLLYFLFTAYLFGSNDSLREVQKKGVTVVDGNKTIVIHRQKSKECDNVHINPKTLFGSDFADQDIPKACKKTFVTVVGVSQPMQIHRDIKTIAELEVLAHIKNQQKKPEKYVLIDGRTRRWYEQMTIPTAVNLPFNQIHAMTEEDDNKLEEFENMVDILGIIQRKSYLDFSRSKTAVIFCNGSWCSQSQKMIIRLINLGYPGNKLLWYRGGMQDWVANGFTTVKGKSEFDLEIRN